MKNIENMTGDQILEINGFKMVGNELVRLDSGCSSCGSKIESLSVTCPTVTVPAAATVKSTYITALADKITIDPNGTFSVYVTWTNTGEVTSDSFLPSVTVNTTTLYGELYGKISRTLSSGATFTDYYKHSIATLGTYVVCTVPSGVSCKTTEVVANKLTATAFATPTVVVGYIGVDITWTNNGEATVVFIPSVSIDGGTAIALTTAKSVAAGETYYFIGYVSATSGSHTICPVPN